MATKRLGAGVTGDLVNDPLYNFGLGADYVYVEAGSGDHKGSLNPRGLDYGLSIRTGAGDDMISTLSADAGSEQWTFAGSGNDRVYGGAARDVVIDGSGNDVVRLGDGADRVIVGAGNDAYDGGAGGEDWISFGVLSFDAETGLPPQAATSGVAINLASSLAQNFGVFGTDVAINFENVSGTGGHDTLTGSAVKNVLYGGLGNDILYGMSGNDDLRGHQGSDVFVGGLGADYLNVSDLFQSAAARDTIVYQSITESGTTQTTRDRISGFDRGGLASDDKINLSTIDADVSLAGNQAFQFSGNALVGLPGNGGQVWLTVQGANTIVNVDNDADAAAEMTFVVEGVTGLTAVDFIL